MEIHLEGINQVEVNHKIGLDFATTLRTFLRQDPDIIMIGEIRDLETAEIAVKAAHTGHLVLATLHTNSATESLTRLLNMGIPSFNLATAINLIISQRLVRKLCPHCKKEHNPPPKVLAENRLEESLIFKANGCKNCHNGYKGRTAIFEMLAITDNISNMIMNNQRTTAITKEAKKQNHISIREAGLSKVRLGITSPEEINRIII